MKTVTIGELKARFSELLKEVQEILKPIHNWVYIEGRPENNDV